mmetsp:Transcript_8408/g.12452  ORF Transcript_8408/g.12452 Transcript_8408/m.12452 type:complete len:833 (-) Transcript_8408:3-2501(-)|eukprot:CAMPEP_0196801682 /NCGR_PEP_ID=MMETSP1362-20130617/1457_1 /TAXON_ID=163516 /ORGANISM="Leptocylindrus danicus, Strain CCMP1856" /LENGTH=832 /DNA_ID=CAMNT_0042172757 /DNA_START=143 /DNA_END=2638 /DNA_ORIENTATION=-
MPNPSNSKKQQKLLNTLYSHLDTGNYPKAYKISNDANIANLKLARSLRSVCLVKMGRHKECVDIVTDLIGDDGSGDSTAAREPLEEDIVSTLKISTKLLNRADLLTALLKIHNPGNTTAIATSHIFKLATQDLTDKEFEQLQISCMSLAKSTDDLKYLGWTVWCMFLRYGHAVKRGESNQPKLALLPRLAEGLATKLVSGRDDVSEQDWRIYFTALENQQKYDAIIEKLENIQCSTPKIHDENSKILYRTNLVAFTELSKTELLAEFCMKSKNLEKAISCYLKLIDMNPNNYRYFSGLKSAMMCTENDKLYLDILSKISSENERNMRLFEIDLFVSFSDDVSATSSKIVKYVESNFKKACAFSDLKFALDKMKGVECFAEKIEELKCARTVNIASEVTEEQLRCYHLCVKILFYLCESKTGELLNELLDTLQLCEKSSDFDESSYEDLQILAGDIILSHRRTDKYSILDEMQLTRRDKSPQSKLLAILYNNSKQNVQVSYDTYMDLNIKYIQWDSLSFVILRPLMLNGYYNECTIFSRNIVGVHVSSNKEVPENIEKSLNNGNYLIADEMLNFQRERMQPSISLVNAKANIINLAPLQDDLSNFEISLDRAKLLMKNFDSQSAATLFEIDFDSFVYADNRDFAVFDFLLDPKKIVSFETCEEMLCYAERTKLSYKLVNTIVLSADLFTVKKGKIKKNIPELAESISCIESLLSIEKIPNIIRYLAKFACKFLTGEISFEMVDLILTELEIFGKMKKVEDIGEFIPTVLAPCMILMTALKEMCSRFGKNKDIHAKTDILSNAMVGLIEKLIAICNECNRLMRVLHSMIPSTTE